MYNLTIFTPTYNRINTLPRLYRSLCRQTDKSFQWLIIDDGSTDNTAILVKEWMRSSDFSITYCYQQNQGKMAAYNYALKKTTSELFFCVDSDDYLVDDAVRLINEKASDYHFLNKNIAGIVAYKGNDKGNLTGSTFPAGIQTSELRNLYKSGFTGETSLIFKTNIAKKYTFPIIATEKFVSEMYVYNQIDDTYLLMIFPEVLTICQYQDDGYTRNLYNLIKNNPMGWALVYLQKADYECNIIQKLKKIAFAESYVMMSSKKARESAKNQGFYKKRVVNVISLPFALLLYLRRILVHRDAYRK